MDKNEINKILEKIEVTKERNIIIVDYGNVQKLEEGLGWENCMTLNLMGL
ncbi:MAG: hypothetical protein V1770_00310 [bacterium]